MKKNVIIIGVPVLFLIVLGFFYIQNRNSVEMRTFKKDALKALEIIEADAEYRNVHTEYVYTIVDGMILAGRVEVQKVKSLNGTITYDKNLKMEYAIHDSNWCMRKDKSMTTFEIIKYNGDCKIGDAQAELASEKCFEFSNGEIINYYEYEENNKKNLTCPKSLIIPDTINGEKVTTIGKEAFRQKGITMVVFSDNITLIKENAFSWNEISNLTIGKNVKTIEKSAFWNNRLKTVQISDSVMTIGQQAFMDNIIFSLAIGKNVEVIGLAAFYNNQLETLTIPGNVKVIEERAFEYNNLINVVLEQGIEEIQASAFIKKKEILDATLDEDEEEEEIDSSEDVSNEWEYSNIKLTTIQNNTGRSFDWGSIINGISGYDFETGIVSNENENVEIK